MPTKKDTERLRQQVREIVTRYLAGDLEKLKPKDRVQALLVLMKYVLPQLRSIEHSGEMKQTITAILPKDLRQKLINGSNNDSR